jgi:hypothetical protein
MFNDEFDNGITCKIKKMLQDDGQNIEFLSKMIFIADFVSLLKAYIQARWGTYDRVTIFGAYVEDGERVTQELSYYISQRGYLAITGKGFYQPGDSTFYPLIDLFPKDLTFIFNTDKAQILLFRSILPALSTYSLDKLYPNRTNAYELEGCADYQVPTLGFIVDERIKQEPSECSKTEIISLRGGFGKECTGSKSADCANARGGTEHCAFYHIIDVPLVQKIWFFTQEDWRLVAMPSLTSLYPFLDSFLPLK